MEDQRPWYKKKRYIGGLAVASIIGIGSLGSTTPPATTQIAPVETAPQSVQRDSQSNASTENEPLQIDAATGDTATQSQPESDVHYYTNVDNNQVQTPTYYDSGPTDASAQCGDGTYSFSQHHQGTCSHHGGVAEWL